MDVSDEDLLALCESEGARWDAAAAGEVCEPEPDGCVVAGLNDEQRKAATFPSTTPLLILAGAGSGKTLTLVRRVACLVLRERRSAADRGVAQVPGRVGRHEAELLGREAPGGPPSSR